MPPIPGVTNPLLLAAQAQGPGGAPPGAPMGTPPLPPGGLGPGGMPPPAGPAGPVGMPSTDPNAVAAMLGPLAQQQALDRQHVEAQLVGQQMSVMDLVMQKMLAMSASMPSPASDAAMTQVS